MNSARGVLAYIYPNTDLTEVAAGVQMQHSFPDHITIINLFALIEKVILVHINMSCRP